MSRQRCRVCRKPCYGRQCLGCRYPVTAHICPTCGGPKGTGARQCRTCTFPKTGYVCPDCGGRKTVPARRCVACTSRHRAAHAASRRPCALCGGPKTEGRNVCNPCRYRVLPPDLSEQDRPYGTCGWCHGPMLLRATYPRRFCGAACAAAWHALDVERTQAQQELRDAWHWWIRTHPAYSSQAFRAAVAAVPRQEAA